LALRVDIFLLDLTFFLDVLYCEGLVAKNLDLLYTSQNLGLHNLSAMAFVSGSDFE